MKKIALRLRSGQVAEKRSGKIIKGSSTTSNVGYSIFCKRPAEKMITDKINCIIIHGCPKNPEKNLDPKARYYHHWIPWVRRELTKKGIKTDTP